MCISEIDQEYTHDEEMHKFWLLLCCATLCLENALQESQNRHRQSLLSRLWCFLHIHTYTYVHTHTAISDHCKTDNHIIDWDRAKITRSENNRCHRWIREAIEIRETGAVDSKLWCGGEHVVSKLGCCSKEALRQQGHSRRDDQTCVDQLTGHVSGKSCERLQQDGSWSIPRSDIQKTLCYYVCKKDKHK